MAKQEHETHKQVTAINNAYTGFWQAATDLLKALTKLVETITEEQKDGS
jgi:hypothetical protein